MLISYHDGRAFDVKRLTFGWKTYEVKSSAEFSSIITNKAWSPIVFKDGHRKGENFLSARLLALDFDNGLYTLAQALKEWSDTIHWIGTTRNHQKEKSGITCDRFRLIVPFREMITDPSLYRYNYQLLIDRYDSDNSTKDRARLFFPCAQIVSVNLDGEFQPIVALPEGYEDQQTYYATRQENYVKAGVIPHRIRHLLASGFPTHKKNTCCFIVGAELGALGFQHEEIIEIILTSKTYNASVVSPDLLKEISNAVRQGLKKSAGG